MPSVYVIDTGLEVGIVKGYYDDVHPMLRVNYWQFGDGLKGFLDWYDFHAGGIAGNFEWVCERFTPRPMQRSFKTEELETIRIEGGLESLLWNENLIDVIHWQRPDRMVLRGGDTPAERKKNSDNLLKEHGLWLTGKKDLGRPDANDVLAATKHLLAYAKSIDHKPSMDLYWPEGE